MSTVTEPLDTLQASIDGFGRDVARAQHLVECGQAVDLAAMEGRMAGLCEAACALPPLLGRQICPELMQLGEAIDRLIAALQRRVRR